MTTRLSTEAEYTHWYTPLQALTYRHHPVTSIMRSAVPTANPDATVTFGAGVPKSPRIAFFARVTPGRKSLDGARRAARRAARGLGQ